MSDETADIGDGPNDSHLPDLPSVPEALTRREDPFDSHATHLEGTNQGSQTRLEQPNGAIATRLEPSDPSKTRLEPPAGQGAPRVVELPAELTDAGYRFVAELTKAGGEADIYQVAAPTGETQVVKKYRVPDFVTDQEIAALLIGADHDHIVDIIQTGVDGRYTWELLEFVPHGNLAELRSRMGGKIPIDLLTKVVRELTDAIDHTHNQLNLVHCDIKPENILVRTESPELDLVLADFGLISHIDAGNTASAKSRTPAYAPPEAIAGAVSAGRDWWSLGMVILEAITGSHPFSADGRWLTEDQITAWLNTRPIPVDSIPDQRWRNLCRGLLTRDPARRWSADSIREWLDGGNPKIFDIIQSGASRPYSFAGELCTDFEELARRFRANWREAARLFGSQNLVAALVEWLQEAQAPSSAIDACTSPVPGNSLNYRLANVIYHLAPTLPPSLLDYLIDKQNLARLCIQAIDQDGKGPESFVINEIVESGLLEVFPSTGELDYPKLNKALQEWIEIGQQTATRFIPSEFVELTPEQTTSLHARILLCLVDRDFIEATKETATTLATPLRSIDWYRSLADRPGKASTELLRDMLLIAYAGRAETIASHSPSMPIFREFRVHPDAIVRGAPVTLSWEVENAHNVYLEDFGHIPSKGSQTIAVEYSRAFVIDARNANGSVQLQSGWVTVLDMPEIHMPDIPVPRQNLQLEISDKLLELGHLPTPFSKSPPIEFLPQLSPPPDLSEASLPSQIGIPKLPTLRLQLPDLRALTPDEESND